MAYQSPLSPVTVTLCPWRSVARTSVEVLGPWRRFRLEEDEESLIVPWRLEEPPLSGVSVGEGVSVSAALTADFATYPVSPSSVRTR